MSSDRHQPAKRIVIADDYGDTVEVWSQLLELFHYEIHKAYDGRQALEMVMARVPDAVILDIGLPMIDGFGVARKLREFPELSRSILIGHTGHCDDDSHRCAQEAGFDYFFEKPADPGVLISCLEPNRYADIIQSNVIALTNRDLQERSRELRSRATALSARSQEELARARELCQMVRNWAQSDPQMPDFLRPDCAVAT
jgi:CheY-like chemotaxis protein